jgi:hypothetical protein
MFSLFCRTAILASVAVGGLSILAQAQSTEVVRERPTELRRATLPVLTAAPIVQQSPNGLFKLSVTDNGIELLGPKGGVKITTAGIELGNPSTQVTIYASEVSVRSGNGLRLDSGTGIDLKGATEIRITGTRVTLGCTNGKPAARVGDAVNTTGSPAVVAQGSQTVLVC